MLSWSEIAARQAVLVDTPHDLRVLHACVNAAMIAGALIGVLERCLLLANTREQFSRPIGNFRAIQHQLAVL